MLIIGIISLIFLKLQFSLLRNISKYSLFSKTMHWVCWRWNSLLSSVQFSVLYSKNLFFICYTFSSNVITAASLLCLQ